MERIEWVDSGMSFASTWLSTSLIQERAREWHGVVVSVGQVVYEDEERLVLGLSHDAETDNWASCFAIYKPCILTRVKLAPAA